MVIWKDLQIRDGCIAAKSLVKARTTLVQRRYDHFKKNLTANSMTDYILDRYPILNNINISPTITTTKTKTNKSTKTSFSSSLGSYNGVLAENPFPYIVSDASIAHWIYWIPLYDHRRVSVIIPEVRKLVQKQIINNKYHLKKVIETVVFQNALKARSISRIRHLHIFIRFTDPKKKNKHKK